VIIGRNNAGKSTLVDALRLVSIVASRYQTLTFQTPPRWASIPRREAGVSPSLEGMAFNFENLFHRYGDPPATILALFDSGAAIKIYVGPEADLHAVLFDKDRKIVTSRPKAMALGLSPVSIMPQVAPLSLNEKLLTQDYVRRNLSSSLAPAHFRNQLNLLRQHLSAFRALAEDSWPGLQVKDLSIVGPIADKEIKLMVRDEAYVAEVATMGHGLQMWLQTMWFLARMPAGATVILDEPDVYMHPDLQRRLIRYLRDRFKQIVVTTHSVEIVSEVASDDILIVERRQSQSRFASSLPAVQRVVNHVGSVHNLQLARLWNAKRCLLVEGKDFQLLCDMYDACFVGDPEGLAVSPNMSIGGWGGWSYAVGSSMLLKNAGGENIRVYCILDADYHTESQITLRLEQAMVHGVELYIWGRKEIENYLVSPQTICRVIANRAAKRVTPPTEAEVEDEVQRICEILRDETFDAMATELLAEDRALGQGGANKKARGILEPRWVVAGSRVATVSGKSVLSRLSAWSKEQFGVSLSASAISKEIRRAEIAPEMVSVLTAIHDGKSVPDRMTM
jgi:AAA domain, putative AbiEii toxin, Type IV TA system